MSSNVDDPKRPKPWSATRSARTIAEALEQYYVLDASDSDNDLGLETSLGIRQSSSSNNNNPDNNVLINENDTGVYGVSLCQRAAFPMLLTALILGATLVCVYLLMLD